jgi:hypothetical protein
VVVAADAGPVLGCVGAVGDAHVAAAHADRACGESERESG